jgi:lysophospholipase L1-like esterase
MKLRILLTAIGTLVCAFAAPVFAQAKPTLYIIGDSTVKNHTTGLEGWGDPIADYFDKSKIDVKNCALGGRSSRTFLTEGLWDKVVQDLKPGDFVLMQFGHNDGGSIETEDIVNPKTNQKETVHTYGWYMTKYVTDAKSKGALPIVLSPIPRNIWSPDNHVGRNTKDYGGWSADVAKAQGVPFVDLNGIIADKYDALGPDKVKAQYFPGDHTHTNPAGAELNASCVVEGLKGLKDDPLAPYLIQK